MKKIGILLGLIILCGSGILFFLGKEVREIKTEIQIAARPSEVWNVLTEFNSWKEWNPTILLAEGTATIGSKLNITINGNGKGDANYQPNVLESSIPNSFRWRVNMMADFIFKNDRVFILQNRQGGTYLIHKEEFSGMMVPLMWGMFEDFVGPTLEKMNEALKKKVESEKQVLSNIKN